MAAMALSLRYLEVALSCFCAQTPSRMIRSSPTLKSKSALFEWMMDDEVVVVGGCFFTSQMTVQVLHCQNAI